jgi:hypothetical protein
MTTLNNPIESQNLIDRFADFVTTVVNGSATNTPADNIIWAADTKPFADFDGNLLTGNLADPITLSIGANNLGGSGAVINANTINRVLLGQLAIYTNVRKLRAILNVTGGGGNTGSRPTAGYVYDVTAAAYFATAYRQSIGAGASDVVSGSIATAAGLETFFDNLRTSYNSARGNTVTLQVNVCHASCHSSCHGSRGRR